MLTTTTRSATEEEIRRLGPSPGHPHALRSRIVSFGLLLIVTPAVGGGMIGRLLMEAGAPREPAYLVGFIVAGAYGVFRLVQLERGVRLVQRESHTRRGRDRASGRVEVLTVSPIEQVWWLDELEDLGPGYLIRIDDERYLCIRTQSFDEFGSESLDSTEFFPGTTLRVERFEASGSLIRVHVAGQPVACAGGVVWRRLGVALEDDCVLLPARRVDAILRAGAR